MCGLMQPRHADGMYMNAYNISTIQMGNFNKRNSYIVNTIHTAVCATSIAKSLAYIPAMIIVMKQGSRKWHKAHRVCILFPLCAAYFVDVRI